LVVNAPAIKDGTGSEVSSVIVVYGFNARVVRYLVEETGFANAK
jgi:hypothetical protein